MNAELTALGNETITSMEVAELTGKRHADVIRDIRGLLKQGVAERNFASGNYLDKNNQNRPCYSLTKKGSLILASGYNAKLREAIINRWAELELEHQNKFQIPQTFAQALQLAANQAEQIEQQQKQLAIAKPKVMLADRFLVAKNSMTIEDFAKAISKNLGEAVGRNKCFKILRDHQILMTNNNPYQKYINSKWFEVKITTYTRGLNQYNTSQTLITPLGVRLLAPMFVKLLK